MFTRCPECATVYRVSAEDLKAADGDVRCGDCGMLFHALDSLSGVPPRGPEFEVESAGDAVYAGDLFSQPQGPAPTPEQAPEGAEESEQLSGHTEPDDPAHGQSDEPAPAVDAPDPEPEGPAAQAERAMERLARLERPDSGGGWGWGAAAVLAALVGVLSLIHFERRELVLVEGLGPVLKPVYAAFGVTLDPPYQPDAMTLSRTEMVSHPSVPGALYLSGTLTNRLSYPQPLPVLRLTMQDRWGELVAARDFRALEYLRGERSLQSPLETGERVPLGIEVLDPSAEAVGFQIEVCMEEPEGLICAAP